MSPTATVHTRTTEKRCPVSLVAEAPRTEAKVSSLKWAGSTLGLTIHVKDVPHPSDPADSFSGVDDWWHEVAAQEWADKNKVRMEHLKPAVESTMKSLSLFVSSKGLQSFPKPIITNGTSVSCLRPTSSQSTTFGLLVDANPSTTQPDPYVWMALMRDRRRARQRNIFLLYEEDQNSDRESCDEQDSEDEDDVPLLQRDF